MTYMPPLADIRFALRHIAEFEDLSDLPGLETAEPDLADAVLEEAGRFGAERIAPLSAMGDRQKSRLENGVVRTPDGFRDTYRAFADAGWNGLPSPADHGGQALPWTLATAVDEIWAAADLSFSLCPLLTQAAVELLAAHGSDKQKERLLPHLISGRWTGTMNLTEPQAGSDLGALKTKADPARDIPANGLGEVYRITGQKIYISWGDQDFTDNILHLVLARTPDAPPGSRGISLFVVPKFMLSEDGSLGARNDVRPVSLEHKMGLHASPTAVMSFGDDGGAVGYRVGEENQGLAYMFTMMNNARLGVGVEGLGVAERAYQRARVYASERMQGKVAGEPSPIRRHPDVRRMLLTMRARIAAMRGLLYYTAGQLDRSLHAPEPEARQRHRMRLELLTPVAKAWCSDLGVAVASTALQVHGGMGYVEETGAAQHLRDARITPIYEGTNGIQAEDLVRRKLTRDQGAEASALIEAIREDLLALRNADKVPDGQAIADGIERAVSDMETATRWMLDSIDQRMPAALAGSVPYLNLLGSTVGSWTLARGCLALARDPSPDPGFAERHWHLSRFYVRALLPETRGLTVAITEAADDILSFPEDAL